MKICIITHEYPPTSLGGGQGTYAMNLVKELISNGHSVTVVTPLFEGGEKHEKSERLEIFRLKVFQPPEFIRKIILNIVDLRIFFGLKIRGFKKKLNIDSYDIIHVLDVHDSYFISKSIKTPVIVSVNDYYSFETPWNIAKFPYPCRDLPFRYIHHNFAKITNSIYLRRADGIISDTKYTADSIERVSRLARKKIDVIYKGIDINKFSCEAPAEKYKSQRILYVGGNMERKGVEYLVRAMALVIRDFPDAKLTIIGRCSKMYNGKLMKIIKKNGLEKNIERLDFCPPATISEHYKKANAFVLPSLMEDLGQVLIEAMSTKTPVVSTNVGANPEAIIDNVTGILVDPKNYVQIADGIKRIFLNPKEAKVMGENGRKRAEEIFNSGRMLRETLEVYKKYLKS